MNIRYHPTFRRNYQKLSDETKRKAERKENKFRKNPFDPALHTHKLRGELSGMWSFSIDQKYRIIFEMEKNEVIFLDVGDHTIYQ